MSAILKTVAQTIHSEHVPVQAFVESGPVPEVHGPMETEEYKECWDDVNGGYLNPEMVAAARQDELKWVDKQQLLEQVPTKMCYEETGRAPITLKWIDTNKGDETSPLYRSRLVVRERSRRERPRARDCLRRSCSQRCLLWRA